MVMALIISFGNIGGVRYACVERSRVRIFLFLEGGMWLKGKLVETYGKRRKIRNERNN